MDQHCIRRANAGCAEQARGALAVPEQEGGLAVRRVAFAVAEVLQNDAPEEEQAQSAHQGSVRRAGHTADRHHSDAVGNAHVSDGEGDRCQVRPVGQDERWQGIDHPDAHRGRNQRSDANCSGGDRQEDGGQRREGEHRPQVALVGDADHEWTSVVARVVYGVYPLVGDVVDARGADVAGHKREDARNERPVQRGECIMGGRAEQGEDDDYRRHTVAQQPPEQHERLPNRSGISPSSRFALRRPHLGVYVRNGQMLTSVRRNTIHMTW
jgi:hypothetical protein